MIRYLILFVLFFTNLMPHSAKAGETKLYKDGDVTLEGYLAMPDPDKFKGERPAILIAHQWKGLGEYEKRRADMLADLGFIAFAVDVYGQGIRPKTTQEALTEATKYKSDPDLARRRMSAALDYVQTLPFVDKGKIAAIGYCFGGTMVLELARSGAKINGVVSFHGNLATTKPAQKGDVKAPILIHHGAVDPVVTQYEVENFKKEMGEAQADWHMIVYADAVHAFTEKEAGDDPSDGAAYNEKADKRSWAYTLQFFDEIFS
ncbi:MAG TPA: dienelactone hydrolase family protein [Alphaproteobacteria bacterium]|nr:dienelactone hydrolase family protein [Alphaproteobacteria bacterium]